MPILGKESIEVLATCHPLLCDLMTEAIKHWDFSIREGYRTLEEQHVLYKNNQSHVRVGYHNVFPSLAVHAIPYPIDWKDMPRFYHLAGIIIGLSVKMNIPVRWGGNWDRSKTTFDGTKFKDLAHFELYGEEYRQLVDEKRLSCFGLT